MDCSQQPVRVTMALNIWNERQEINENGAIFIFESDIENFVGTDYDDILSVNLLEHSGRFLDGGPHENGDQLNLDTEGLAVISEDSTYKLEGYGDINYQNFEFFTFLNVTDVEENDGNIPRTYQLSQNYPNPFNPATTINYDLPGESRVNMQVFNILGEKVAVLINNEVKAAGYHNVKWTASNLPSGFYFLRAEIESVNDNQKYSFIRKMLLIK